MKNKYKIVLALAIFIVCGIMYSRGGGSGETCDMEATVSEESQFAAGKPVPSADAQDIAGSVDEIPGEQPDKTQLYVYVCGAVENPGVFELPAGSRIADALELAGGFSSDASREAINLASYINDGDMIYVPEAGGESGPAQSDVKDDGRIDINSAGKSELMTLAGIGSSKADAIISYRNKTPFTCIEDIMKVPGIKEGSFEKIKEQIVAR